MNMLTENLIDLEINIKFVVIKITDRGTHVILDLKRLTILYLVVGEILQVGSVYEGTDFEIYMVEDTFKFYLQGDISKITLIGTAKKVDKITL